MLEKYNFNWNKIKVAFFCRSRYFQKKLFWWTLWVQISYYFGHVFFQSFSWLQCFFAFKCCGTFKNIVFSLLNIHFPCFILSIEIELFHGIDGLFIHCIKSLCKFNGFIPIIYFCFYEIIYFVSHHLFCSSIFMEKTDSKLTFT